METKNYLLIVVVILAFALVSVNLGDLTGSTTKTNPTTVKVSPIIIKAGEQITISVNPGVKGVKNEVGIYRGCNTPTIENCVGSRIALLHLCSGVDYTKNCRNPVITKYHVSSGLQKGRYYIIITEYLKDNNSNYLEKKAYFDVE